MSKIILSLIFYSLTFNAVSQKVYFVYLQSEAEQPFFVKMNDKPINSISSGYLILSKLRDSVYTFNIGFPGNNWPEQKFSVKIDSKDHGYLIKNFPDKGWGLFDLQTSAVQMAMVKDAKQENVVMNREVSMFTEILSKAVDDTTLKQRTVQPIIEEKKPELVIAMAEKKEEPKAIVTEPEIVKKEEKKIEINPIQEEKKLSTGVNEVINPAVQKILEADQTNIREYKKSTVSRKSESSTTEGFGLVFIDEYEDGTKDTINIIIPNPKPLIKEVITEPVVEKKFLEITSDTTKFSIINSVKEIKDTALLEERGIKKNEKILTKQDLKNNCSAIADENDFLELRKKMATATNNDGMLDEVRKYFKLKCFSSSQVRNLGFLFLNDEGKYRFFDASYNFVTDVENFGSLQSELKDEYYINRFKSMLRN